MSHPLSSSLSPIVTAPKARGLDSIREQVEERGIRRLCHFTPSRYLFPILSSEHGLRSLTDLRRNGIEVFCDRFRLDGHPDHLCLSVQSPNARCFKKIRLGRQLGDWVVLFIEPVYLWQPGTKFCPVNAATASGDLIREGPDGFRAMFDSTVAGRRTRNGCRTHARRSRHPDFLPTSTQAEVLVPNGIPRKHITGVAVGDEAQAAREHYDLLDHGITPPPLVVVPEFYEPRSLSGLLRVGKMPVETPWRPQNR